MYFALAVQINLVKFDCLVCSFSAIVNLSFSGCPLGLATIDDWTKISFLFKRLIISNNCKFPFFWVNRYTFNSF